LIFLSLVKIKLLFYCKEKKMFFCTFVEKPCLYV
jgi:hypothetical protein